MMRGVAAIMAVAALGIAPPGRAPLVAVARAWAPAAPTATRAGDDPASFVLKALGAHRRVFLGDIHPLAEPKQVLVEVLERADDGHRVDVLALEVAAEQQEWIDAYLASAPEDVGILLQHGRTLREHWGASAEYLAIYRAVYRLNRVPGRRPIRIVAADARGWPIAPLSEMMAAGGTASRDEWMARAFTQRFRADSTSHVLVFMGGYHGLKAVGARVTVGHATADLERWFAGHLEEAGMPIYTIVADAPQGEGGRTATRVYERLRTGAGLAAEPGRATPGGGGAACVALDESTDDIREPLVDVDEVGYHLAFAPARFAMRRAADAMLIIAHGTPITPASATP